MNKFFWDNLSEHSNNIALSDGITAINYARLDNEANRTVNDIPARSLVFCVCKNSIASVTGYIGFLKKRIVPIMISAQIDKQLFHRLKDIYRPQYIWTPEEFYSGESIYKFSGYSMINENADVPKIHNDLALLLTTSGSTGSPKFVRQSYKNIQANTKSIVEYLEIKPEDRAVTTMPMSYTYGLSIIQSHLMAGACIFMNELTFFDKAFWQLLREKNINTFGAVPYTYKMLDKLRFLKMNLPSLRYITQAGGRLGEELHKKFALGMREQGKNFIVMYGATEATARMSYVPAKFSVEKAGSIGIAIPGGRFELIDDDGKIIEESGKIGELVYYGDNVTPGYAECREDLAKGDENNGRLFTGDMAMRDDDGYYFVAGRKKRFLKIFGNRVNLAELEEILLSYGFECACTGEDDQMRIYTTSEELNKIIELSESKTHLNRQAFKAIHIDEIPRNDAGKILYSELI